MMIKITRGYYGHRNGRIVEMKDIHSPAFEVDEAEAQRVISLGIAKADNATDNDTGKEVTDSYLTIEQLQEMSYNQLKQLCKELGLSAVGKQNELIARILGTKVQYSEPEEELNTENNEDFPTLNPAEPED